MKERLGKSGETKSFNVGAVSLHPHEEAGKVEGRFKPAIHAGKLNQMSHGPTGKSISRKRPSRTISVHVSSEATKRPKPQG